MERHATARQATDNNIADAHCVLDNVGYKHALRKYNTYCFSTATMAVLPRLTLTLYVHCLSCILFLTVVLVVKDRSQLNLTSNRNVNGTMCGVYAICTRTLQSYVTFFSASCNEWHHDSDSGALVSDMMVRSQAEEDFGLTVKSIQG